MVYMMQLGGRLAQYRETEELMKDPKYEMIEVMRFTNESLLPTGFNKGATSFIFEFALHSFVDQFNDDFFTRPGAGPKTTFLDHHSIDAFKKNPWIKTLARERLISALVSKKYVVEEVDFLIMLF